MFKIRLAIAGLGTVGCGVINMIQTQKPQGLEIVAVSARDRTAQRGADISAYEWCDDPLSFIVRDDIDCVVELVGGSEGIAKQLVTESIKAGKALVTANKALIADHGAELSQLVDQHRVFFGYEAAVAGGIPVIKSLREAFVGNDIRSLSGILNGTSNYILSVMAETGRDFDDVLKEAQNLGYAEADPSFDVGGVDAAHKLAIMAGIAFKARIDFKDVHVRGITEISAEDMIYARDAGYRVKLLGVAKKCDSGDLLLSVEPCFVHKSHPIAHVDGALNAVTVQSEPLGMSMLVGSGAGAGPTASSVYSDLIDLMTGATRPLYNVAYSNMSAVTISDQGQSRYYLRLSVYDKVGVIAELSAILAEFNLSMSEFKQNSKGEGQAVDLFIILHDANSVNIKGALAKIERSPHVLDTPLALKIIDN